MGRPEMDNEKVVGRVGKEREEHPQVWSRETGLFERETGRL